MTLNSSFGRTKLAAKVAKAKQGGGFAYRLGWVLYWACLALAGSWVLFLAGWMAMVSGTVTEGVTQIIREPLSFLILFGIPVLALYGLGRAFRYVLSGG